MGDYEEVFDPILGKNRAKDLFTGSGLLSINGLTPVAQLLAVASAGSDFNVVSSGATHTFNLPTASALNRGALSSTDWSTFNSKLSNISGQDHSTLNNLDFANSGHTGFEKSLTFSTGLTRTVDTITTNDSQIVHDNLNGFVADEHIDHSGVNINAGGILSGGGDITTSRTITLNQSDIDHDQLLNYVAGEHFLQSAITQISAGVGDGLVKSTSGTLSVITDNSTNWNTAYGWGDHAGLYDPIGTASGLISTHESTYNHSLIATALQNIVEDTTPQLGGDLDTNAFDIKFLDNDKSIFGTGLDFEIYHDTNDTIFRNLLQDKDTIFYVNYGSVDTEIIRLDGNLATFKLHTDRFEVDSIGRVLSLASYTTSGNDRHYDITTTVTSDSASASRFPRAMIATLQTAGTTDFNGISQLYGLQGQTNLSADVNVGEAIGLFGRTIIPNGNNSTTTLAIGMAGELQLQAGTGGSVTLGVGLNGNMRIRESVTVTDATSINADFTIDSGDTLTSTNSYYFKGTDNIAGSGNITNFYGLYLPSITDGTNNWAIKTNSGLVEFGDDLKLYGNITHDDVTASDWVFRNADQDKDIIFQTNDGGVTRTNLQIFGASNLVKLNRFLQIEADGASANVALNPYGSFGNLFTRRRNGTIASPTAVLNNDILMRFGGGGYTGVGLTGNTAQVDMQATENWSASATGTQLSFDITPNGSTTRLSSLVMEQNGNVTFPFTAGCADCAVAKYEEKDTTPTNPTQDVEVKTYMKDDKFIWQFNNGGTVRYFYIDLTATAAQQVQHTTTAP